MINKMKCVVVLFCLIVAGCSGDYRSQLKSKLTDVVAVCVPESKATETDIAEIMNKKTPTRMEGKCLISCFYKKLGLQNDAGEPSKEGALAFLEPFRDENPELYAKLLQLVLKCGPKVYEMGLPDHCETASELSTCVMSESNALGIADPFCINE